MDLIEQEKLSKEIEKFMQEKLKGKIFHSVTVIETAPGNAFVFENGSLTERSPFQACKAMTNALTRYIEVLAEKFNTPTTTTINGAGNAFIFFANGCCNIIRTANDSIVISIAPVVMC